MYQTPGIIGFKYSPRRGGKYVQTIGRSGSKHGELMRPRGIAIGTDNCIYIYVSDCKNRRISVFKTNGNFVKCLGESGDLGR